MFNPKKKVFIVSNYGEDIAATVEKHECEVVGAVKHESWAGHLAEIELCDLLILDEVDQFARDAELLEDEEERLLSGEYGPLVLILVRDDDCRLDDSAKVHSRRIVHHISEPLDGCLAELLLATSHRRGTWYFQRTLQEV